MKVADIKPPFLQKGTPVRIKRERPIKASQYFLTNSRKTCNLKSPGALRAPSHPTLHSVLGDRHAPYTVGQENHILGRHWAGDASVLEVSVTEQGIWRIKQPSLNKSHHYLSTIFGMLATRHTSSTQQNRSFFSREIEFSQRKDYTNTKLGVGKVSNKSISWPLNSKVNQGKSLIRACRNSNLLFNVSFLKMNRWSRINTLVGQVSYMQKSKLEKKRIRGKKCRKQKQTRKWL